MTDAKRAASENMRKATVDSTSDLNIFNDDDQNREYEMEDEEMNITVTEEEIRSHETPIDMTWFRPPSLPTPVRIYKIPDTQEIVTFKASLRNEYFTRHPIQWWGFDAQERTYTIKKTHGRQVKFYNIQQLMRLNNEALDRLCDRNLYNPCGDKFAKAFESYIRKNQWDRYASFKRDHGQKWTIWKKGKVWKIYTTEMIENNREFELPTYERRPAGCLTCLKSWKMNGYSTNLIIEFTDARPPIELNEYDSLKQFELVDLKNLSRLGAVEIPRSVDYLKGEGKCYKETLIRLITIEENIVSPSF